MYSGKGTGSQGFDKGHLNAAHINSFDKQHVLATFTYSNAVPQYGHFNRGAWSSYEDKIVKYVTSQCAGQRGTSAVMYLLTGTSKFRLQVRADKPAQDEEPSEVGRIQLLPDTSHGRTPKTILFEEGCLANDKPVAH